MTSGSARAALDLGSAGIKAVVLDEDGRLLWSAYRPVRGDPQGCLAGVLAELARADPQGARISALTGSSAPHFAEALGVAETNEILAAALGARHLVPAAGAVLEVGGEHAKFLRLGSAACAGAGVLRDFALNSACSAGTGTCLEQEAHRLHLGIEEFAARALTARGSASVAGRCAVFAKTDVVHKHQNGLPLEDLAYALCLAMARCIGGELIGGRAYDRPLAFVGGVASNAGMARALRDVLGLSDAELVIPPEHRFADVIGAVLAAEARGAALGESTRDARGAASGSSPGGECAGALGISAAEALRRIEGLPRSRRTRTALLPPLRSPAPRTNGGPPEKASRLGADPRDVALGIDIGSTSTNVALVTSSGEVLEELSVPTRGQALPAVSEALERLEARRGGLVCRALGVTGSGRKLVAGMLDADLAINEITAHAAGCARFFPDADSIFDIGGQDSKFIRLDHGQVTGFEMNKVCAAGTGSFLEEMAELLGLSIVDEFAREALRATAPIDLGERCTVFVASDVARRLQEGALRTDLAAGLAYAVVRNYLARVVGRHRTGERIVFQGGVAANLAVVAAVAQSLGREVLVHPHHASAGAIGAALLAARAGPGAAQAREIRREGLAEVRHRSFDCHRCANGCTIHVTRGHGGRRFSSGGVCDRYESRGARVERPGAAPRPSNGPRPGGGPRPLDDARPDLFAEREEALLREIRSAPDPSTALGIPRALIFHEMLPFWGAFFAALGIGVRLSEPTTRRTLDRGAALCRRGTCLPVRIAHGHCAELLEAGVRRIFVPSIAGLADRTVEERLDHLCPVEQAWPYTARAVLPAGAELVAPRLRFSIPHVLRADLVELGAQLGAGRRATLLALEAGRAAQARFHAGMRRRGAEVLAACRPDSGHVAVLARSYTVGDACVLSRLRRALDEAGLLPVPMDMLPDEPLHSADLNGMYWYFGKRVLQHARALRRAGGPPVLFVSGFGCGPDSFLVHMLRRELGEVPSLELEVDEHSEFNGVHTRIEAFRHSLGAPRRAESAAPPAPKGVDGEDLRGRRLQIPQMSDHAFAFAAAFRSFGVDAEVLPMPDEESIALGRLALGGGECLPCACTVGDMLRCAARDGGSGPPPAFFMVSGDGPCRLGQYPWLQRVALDEHGHRDVPIFNASQDPSFYDRFGMVPATFQRTVWRGTVAVDALFRKGRECRARALDRAEADVAHGEGLRALESCLERGEDVRAALRRAFDRLDRVPRRAQPPAVIVGLLGENYVRCNSAANGRLAEQLEDLGADVWFPSLCEWVEYTNWTARLHCRYERRWKQYLRLAAVEAAQRWERERVEGAVRGRLVNDSRPPLARIFRNAAPYAPASFEGETVVGVGRTVDLHRRGVGGVINVAPFGCMVGGILEVLFARISEDLGGFPILCLQYDGRDTEATRGLLEGFVMRAHAWQKEHGREAR